jgi:hypothetical protein
VWRSPKPAQPATPRAHSGANKIRMSSEEIQIVFLVPFALALVFLLWVFWNLAKQRRR